MSAKFSTVIACLALAGIMNPGEAQAELRENTVSVEPLLIFPRFDSPDPTAFTLTTWGTRASVARGVTDDLHVLVRGSFWLHAGTVKGWSQEDRGQNIAGNLSFHGEAYRAELGLKYKLISGYRLAPYLEASAGYQWTTYRKPSLATLEGVSYGVKITNFGRGSATASGGLSMDYRFADTLFAGVGVYWTQVFDTLYVYDLQVPITLAYYWF